MIVKGYILFDRPKCDMKTFLVASLDDSLFCSNIVDCVIPSISATQIPRVVLLINVKGTKFYNILERL